MEIIYQLSAAQIEDLHALFQKEWWTKNRTLKETANCVKGSQVCIGLVDEDARLRGFIRVISDLAFKALILDLIIENSYRGKGLSKKLMSLVKEHKDLMKVKHFELYCLPELESFYKKFEFTDDIQGVTFLRCENTSGFNLDA